MDGFEERVTRRIFLKPVSAKDITMQGLHQGEQSLLKAVEEIIEKFERREPISEHIRELKKHMDNKENYSTKIAEYMTLEGIVPILTDFASDENVEEVDRQSAIKILCAIVNAFPTKVEQDLVDTLVQTVSNSSLHSRVAGTLCAIAVRSSYFRKYLRSNHIGDLLMKTYLTLHNDDNFQSIINLVQYILDPERKSKIFEREDMTTFFDFVHVALWAIDQQFLSGDFEASAEPLKHWIPVLTYALVHGKRSGEEVGGLACRVLMHFSIGKSSCTDMKIVSADLVSHIVQLLHSEKPEIVIRALRCIAAIVRNGEVGKAFVKEGALKNIHHLLKTDCYTEAAYAALKAIVSAAPPDLSREKIPRDIVHDIFSVLRTTDNDKVRRQASSLIVALARIDLWYKVYTNDFLDLILKMMNETDDDYCRAALLTDLENFVESPQNHFSKDRLVEALSGFQSNGNALLSWSVKLFLERLEQRTDV